MVNFTLACDTRTKDKQGNKVTNFYRVAVWGRMATPCKSYLHKGDRVYVEGELIPRTYEAKGETKVSLDVTASEVQFLSEKSSAQGTPTQNNNAARPEAESNDDLPF